MIRADECMASEDNIQDIARPPVGTDNDMGSASPNDEEEAFGYGERTCLECGKKFIALHFAQICCSEECRKLRRKNKNRANVMRHVNHLRNRIIELEKRNAELEAMILDKDRQIARQQRGELVD